MAQLLHLAQKAIVEKDGKVLVIKNLKRAKYNPGMVHFPGGRMKFGEEIDEHLIREVREETGVKIKPLEILGMTTWIVYAGQDNRKELVKDDLQVVAIIRRCKYVSGKVSLKNNVDDEPIAEAMWRNPKELLKDNYFDKKLLPALKSYLKIYE